MLHPSDSGVVRPDELYTLEALKVRLGIKDAALRSARRAGLAVHYRHGRGFVLGRDWIEYVVARQAPTAIEGGKGGHEEN